MIHVKKLLNIITILCAANLAMGQITVTDATFPAAGDTLKTATDNSPEGIIITGTGGPFTWDYSTLNADARLSTPFQPASEGMASASYPSAELVVILDAGAETYYDVTPTVFSNLGISGSEFLGGFPLDADLKFVPPMQERQAPLTYPSVFNSSSALTIALPISAIPGGIIDSLGIPTGFIDSIGVKFTITRADFVDAFGSLAIPGGTYEVLRQKRTDYSNTRLEVYNALLGWQDVTDLVPLGGFGTDTTISYQFLSNTEKEPIAIVTMDSTGLVPVFVDFKDNGVASAIEVIIPTISDVVVYPNPTQTNAMLSFTNLDNGQYTLSLYNAFGTPLLSQDVTSGFAQIPLSAFSAGLYVYHLTNQKGQSVASGKLIKIKS